jgi:hypothetical protein
VESRSPFIKCVSVLTLLVCVLQAPDAWGDRTTFSPKHRAEGRCQVLAHAVRALAESSPESGERLRRPAQSEQAEQTPVRQVDSGVREAVRSDLAFTAQRRPDSDAMTPVRPGAARTGEQPETPVGRVDADAILNASQDAILSQSIQRIGPRAPRSPPIRSVRRQALSAAEVAEANRLIAGQRLQELAWFYRRRGMEDLARQTEQTLEARLSRYTLEDVVRDEIVGAIEGETSGVSQTRRITFRDGTVAYFKPARVYQEADQRLEIAQRKREELSSDAVNHYHEIAAHRLDQAMGADLVPTTVEWVYKGRVGSLQYGMQIDPKANLPLPGVRRMRLLDYLMGNVDRHGGNEGCNSAGDCFGIDHGLAFYEGPADGLLIRSLYFDFRERSMDEIRLTLRREIEFEGPLTEAAQREFDARVRRKWSKVYGQLWTRLLEYPAEMWTSSRPIVDVIGRERAEEWSSLVLERQIDFMVPDRATYEWVRALTPEIIRSELQGVLPESEIQQVIHRRDTLLRRVDTRNGQRGGRFVIPDARPASPFGR